MKTKKLITCPTALSLPDFFLSKLFNILTTPTLMESSLAELQCQLAKLAGLASLSSMNRSMSLQKKIVPA